MNGLQSVSVSLGKRIRCLPICPTGTRGRILCRRLGHANTQAAQTHNVREPFQPQGWQPPLDSEAIQSISEEAVATVHRLKRVLDKAVQDSESSEHLPSATRKTSPKPKGPLDPSLTGLSPIAIPSTDTPIGHLLHAIDRRDGAEIWESFLKINQEVLIGELRALEFSALLLSLRPEEFLSLRARHRLGRNGKAYIIDKERAYGKLKNRLLLVVSTIRRARHQLGVREYGHLLECARAGRDPRMAEEFWSSMAGNRVEVDTWVHNSYMNAICNGAPSFEREFSVNESTLEHRMMRSPEDTRFRALKLFRAMLRKGIVPNSMTFDILIVALAKMGDVEGLTKTIHRAWGIDVGALPDEAAVAEHRVSMPADSPLYPTEETLLSIATAFCQNGQVDVAVRTVDHMSRFFQIPISMPTWAVLLNWTYVYTRQRKTIPAQAAEGVWKIMTSGPYNVRPTMEMYDYIIRSYLWRRMPEAAEKIMDQAVTAFYRAILRKANEIEKRIIYRRTIRGPKDVEDRVRTFRIQKGYTQSEIGVYTLQVAKLARDEERARSMIRRWTELLVIGKDLEVTVFGPQTIPNIVDKWSCFMGDNVIYVPRTGWVQLELGQNPDPWKPMQTRKRRRRFIPLGAGAKEEDDFF